MESISESESELSAEESEIGFEIKERKISMELQHKMRMIEIVAKLRWEMEKRDKILDLLVSGGDVTLVHVNLDVDRDSQTLDPEGNDKAIAVKNGTKTFEMLIKTIPYKVETVTLNQINWDELINSLEKERSEISLFSEDVKPKPEPQKEKESQVKSELQPPSPTDVNADQKIFSRPAKRRLSKILSEFDETATTICENQNQNQNQPDEKQAKLEENEKNCDFVCELPEYLMDKSFFETKHPSNTSSKFLLRLHDNNTHKICLYDISRSRGSKSISSQKFELNLEEITAAINVHNSSNPGSKVGIWCDINNFDIFSGSSSNSARNFFQLFGKFISHFSFCLRHSADRQNSSSSSSSSIGSNLLIGFILQNFPNLEFLSINSEMLNNLDDLKLNLNLPLKFHRLKTLKIVPWAKNAAHFSHLFFAKLLKRAPRLESIHGIPLNCIKETAELDKILMEDSLIEDPLNLIGSSIPTLKILSCFMLKDSYFKDLNKYSNDLFNLYNFKTGTRTGNENGSGTGRMIVALQEFRAQRYFIKDPVVREKVGQLMTRILQMNKESLLKLILEPSTNPQKALTIPRLENLKILRFDFGMATFTALFPRGFQLSHTFPKLEQVEMFLAAPPALAQKQHANNLNFRSQNSQPESKSRISPDFLRCGEMFETVRNLLLRGIFLSAETGTGSGCLLKIRSMFPNLTKLQLHCGFDEISGCLHQIFEHFPQLQQLFLEIDTDSRHGNLDAALTGIDKDFCKKLEKFVPCPIEGNGKEKMLQIIQNGRSLSDLKELRLLKFVLRSAVTRELNKIPAFTPVSFEYGLGPEQLKNVKIFLDFHEKTSREVKADILTALGPVLPFMTVL